MKHAVKSSLLVGLVTMAVGLPSVSFATNGMFLIGQGAKSRGMGGVAIAYPQDALAGAVNPASIGFVGSRVDIGGDLFLPNAESELGGFSRESTANTFVMPAMGGTYKFNRKLTFGFSAIPAGGGGSRYNKNLYNNTQGTDVNKTLGVNLMILQMSPAVAYRINKQNQVGAGLVIGVQTFRAFGLDYFGTFTSTFSNSNGAQFPQNLTGKGNAWSYGGGVRLGWMGRFMDDQLSLGAAYTSRIYMSKFYKYADLFAEHGDIDTPSNFGIGMAYEITPDLTVAVDVTRTLYSQVNSIGNASAGIGTSPYPVSQAENSLGNDNGLGFGWSDQTVYKLGAAYKLNDQWTARAGWNYGKSPIDETNGEVLFNIVAPAVVQNHLTLGTTYSPSQNVEWSFSYVHAFTFEQSGPTYIGSTGSLKMLQNSFGVSFGYKL